MTEQLKNYFITESNELIYYSKLSTSTYWLKTYERQYGMGFFSIALEHIPVICGRKNLTENIVIY